jgi:hypothetical protein
LIAGASIAFVAGVAPPASADPPQIGVNYYIFSWGPDPNDDDDLLKVVDVKSWSTQDRGIVHLWDLRWTGNVLNQRWRFYWNPYIEGTYLIVNAHSGKCLDKSMDRGNFNGAPVYQYTCHYGSNQSWRLLPRWPDGTGPYRLQNQADFRCLDVTNYRFQDGTPLTVWNCHTGWNQYWGY